MRVNPTLAIGCRLAVVAVAGLAFLPGCRTVPPPPPPPPEPPPVVSEAAPAPPPAVPERRVRVTGSSLNVRSGPSTADTVVGKARRGESLTVIAAREPWLEVRLASGATGWVHSRYVAADQPCLPDKATAELVEAPPLSFSDLAAHGRVRIEAQVGADGVVGATRVVENTTGSEAAAVLAESELQRMRFAPPVRRCRPVRFVYVYTRTF